MRAERGISFPVAGAPTLPSESDVENDITFGGRVSCDETMVAISEKCAKMDVAWPRETRYSEWIGVSKRRPKVTFGQQVRTFRVLPPYELPDKQNISQPGANHHEKHSATEGIVVTR